MSELYRLDSTDENILLAAGLLLRKLATSRIIRPAQLVTVAKLLHLLSVLPRVTNGVTASVSIANRTQFTNFLTTFDWQFSVEQDRIKVSCGYNEYDPAVGGDYYETMRWSASPGKRTEYNDSWDERWMVPELGYYPEHDIDIDFASGEYSVTIEDHDNPLLNDQGDDEDEIVSDVEVEEAVEEESTESHEPAKQEVPEPWSIKPVDVFETWIASQVSPQEVNAREPAYSDGVEECGICGCNLNYRGLYVNGRLRGDLMWSNMCTECLKGAGEGIGCGKGQLYARQQNGDWRLVAGWCPEEDELPPSD